MDIKYAYYRSSVGYKIEGKTDNDILTTGGSTRAINIEFDSALPNTVSITVTRKDI